MKSIFTQGRLSLIVILVFALAGVLQAQPGGWSINPTQFQYNMTITAQIQVNGVQNNALDNHLAVFCKGQIRGYAKATAINGQAYYFISAFANTFQGDSLYFRAYLESDQKIYESTDTVIFRHQKIVGKIASPFPVHLFLGENPLIYSLSEVSYGIGTCPDVVDVQSSDNHDSEGDGLSYSIVGGDDAAKFSIDANTGLVSWFNFTPVFNPPGDANGDNKYQLSVKVTDASGHSDIQHLTVKVVLELPLPPLSCPPNLTLNTSSDGIGDCGATTDRAMIYALNPCALEGITYELTGATIASGSGQILDNLSFLKGITTATYRRGASECSFKVTITDDELPTITCPADTTVETDGSLPCALVVDQIDAIFGDNCAGATLNHIYNGVSNGSGDGQLSGQTFAVGATEVLYTVTDAVSHSVGCTFTITVVDAIPPAALCQNDTVQLDQNGMASILPSDIDNGSSDGCGIESLSVLPNSFTCANAGDNTVTLTVTDLHNLVSTCTATVFVKALSLGNLVYNDLNRNGLFDAGDAGINGVLCNLYKDDGDGVLDAGDGNPTATFTTSTLNGQAGAYLFTLLCPDDYLVEIAPSNFNSGGPLYDNGLMAPLISSPLGAAPDPDNDLNGDDNGEKVGGYGVTSSAITLALNLEPDNDGDADKNTNLSLDFGFKTPATVSIGDVTLAEGTGGATTAFNFTVTRSDNVDAFDLVVNTNNGTAENTSDYTAISNGTVSFSAGGSLTEIITVLVNHDNMVEANETFTVDLTDPNGHVKIEDASGLGTINNDDNAIVTLSGGTAQNEGSAFTFTATLDNPVQGGFSVAYTTNDGTATTADNDYTDQDGSLNFVGTAGETKTITVNTTTDNKVELDETFTSNLGAITGAPAGVSTAGSPQTGSITNDDAAIIAIAANISQAEASTPQTFSVTLSNPVDVAVTVDFSTSNGTATTTDNDYNGIGSQTVTFPTGSTANQTVEVVINNDNKVEADEVYHTTIGNLSASGRNVSLGAFSRTGTMLNDDAAVVTLSGGIAQNEGNTGTIAYLFTATLDNAVQDGFTANYSTNDGTATTANNDYINNDASLSFAGNAGESQTFTVLVNGDLNIEADEIFQTAINSLTGIPTPPAVTIAGSPQTATIINDELDWSDAPTAAQSGFAGTYPSALADNGARHSAALGGLRLGATIDADLDGQPNATATGDGADENGVTLPSAIVINNNANITVNASAAGNLNAWVDFNRNGDWSDAGEQIFTDQSVVSGDNNLSFAVPGAASLGGSFARFRLSTAPGTSIDGPAADGEVEDYAVTIVNTQFTINDPILTEGNAGTSNLSFVITRTVNSNACSVDYAITGGTASVADNDYQALAAGTVNFTAGGAFSQTVNVVVNGDLKVELDETVDMTLSNPVNASILDGAGTATITNDDAAIITITNPAVTEGDVNTNTTLTFTINMSNPSDADVVLNYASLDGTATITDNDYTSANGSLTYTPGQQSKTVSVTGIGDCTIEANETFLLRLSALVNNARNISLNGGGATLDGTGALNNDDALPVISCPANLSKNVDFGFCTTSVTLPLPTTSSICGASTLEFRYRSVDNQNNPTGPFNAYAPAANNTVVFSSGRYEIEWRITDGSGSSVCSFYLTVVDNQPPNITCPPNQFINANAACTGLVGAWNPLSLSDNCTPVGQIVVGQSPLPSTVLMGHNASALVTLSARDLSFNVATCSFTVTLRDVTPPLAKCKNITANLGANGLIKVLPTAVNNGSSDNCGFVMTLTPNTFTCSNIGLNTVTLKVTDNGGNTATCTARVTVKDVTGPSALCKNATILLNDLGQATLTAAQVNNNSSDNCGIASISINRTSFNCSDISGSNPVTLTLKDVNGNTSTCVAQVIVKDAIAPTAVCEDITVKLSQAGNAVVFPANLADNSIDNCSVWSYSPTSKIYTTANIGNNNLTITVKDWSGNSATCVSVVTVQPFNFNSDNGARNDPDQGVTAVKFPITFFPNPTSGTSTLMFELLEEQSFCYRLLDLSGRVVFKQDGIGKAGENQVPIHLGGLAKGLYMLDFHAKELQTQVRILLQE